MRYLQAFLISLVITVLAGKAVIPVLRRLKAGQSIKKNGPVWHMSKEGTPTMGGIMFITGMLCAVVVTALLEHDWSGVAMFGLALVYGVIGFIDDYQKVRHHRNDGLTGWQKILLQLVVALAFLLLMRCLGKLTPNLYVPFFNVCWLLPEPMYMGVMAFAIVGCVNAVNLTDGVDGLVSGVTLPLAMCCCALAAIWKETSQGAFAAALTAGLLGFLVYNFHPAKVFMGDTGSLFLGGAVCALAFAMDMPLALIPLGIVYIIEALSDVIQVGYFKLTHGKRVFRMAPIHHHFEKGGWSEIKVFTVFTGVSLLFAVLSFFGMMNRYHI